MNKDKPEKKILIVSDSADELRSVQDLLTPDLGGYWCADHDTEALNLFTEKQPAVLILAFLEIEKAERFYLTLFRQCSQIQNIPHQTLVLCKNTEAEHAFSLCLSGTVDDYVVNRPLYDLFRLRLSVRQALDRRLVHQQSTGLSRQLAGIGKDLHWLDDYVGKALASGERRYQDTLQAFNDYNRHLGNHLSQLENSLSEPAPGHAVPMLDRSVLSQQFDQVRRKAMGLEAHQVQQYLRESGTWLKQFSESYREHLKPLRRGPFPPPLPEVMIVEDDPVYREILDTMLHDAGFRTVHAANGEEALAGLNRRRPDIMLLDYRMPGLDGIATLKRMKSDANLRAVPVIMLSAISEKDVVSKSIQIGAMGFIVKPGDRQTILGKIMAHLPQEVRMTLRPDTPPLPPTDDDGAHRQVS